MTAKTDYAVHPGFFLREWLDTNNKTPQELGDAAGMSHDHTYELIGGTAALSPEDAAKLASVTGYSIKFWLNAEAAFRADLARLAPEALRAPLQANRQSGLPGT